MDNLYENYEMEESGVMSNEDENNIESSSEKGVAGIVVAGIIGVATLGIAAYKKHKAKKEGAPKKKRKKWVLVEVDDAEPNDIVEVEKESEEATNKE